MPPPVKEEPMSPPPPADDCVVSMLPIFVDGVEILEPDTTPPRSRDSSPARGGWAQPSPPRGGAASIRTKTPADFTAESLAEMFKRADSPFGPGMQTIYREAQLRSTKQQETFRSKMDAAVTKKEKQEVLAKKPQDEIHFLLQVLDTIVDPATGTICQAGVRDMQMALLKDRAATRNERCDDWKRDWLDKNLNVYTALAENTASKQQKGSVSKKLPVP
jgi:hypothetical protein